MKYILIKKKEPVLLLQSKRETESSAEENKHTNPQTNAWVRNIHQPCLKSRHISKHSVRLSRGFESGAPNDCFLFRRSKNIA